MLKIYDTMSRDLREFIPIEEGKVRMYVCGPTVYNYIHVGNARSTVAFDTIRRYFEYRGYEVAYISNFTDVDDKIINRAKEEGITPQEVADKYIAAFREDVTALGVKPATRHPRVVEFMDDIIRFVNDLIEKGYAYESQGDVYFRVEKSHNYAKLANKTLEDLELGASGRTDEETARKENPVDFALWKAAKPGEISWDSPWGPGRPGWHIECSVMSTGILGDTIDIHGGGADLEFPHHTNEIAQSEAKTGKTFANYWMHNGFVNIDNVKMSKSLGNGIDPLEIIDQYGADALRLTLITGNAPGNDMRFYYEKVAANRNFANKVWNASRFIMMNMEGKEITVPAASELEPVDKWILSKCNTLVKDVTENMENYDLGIAVQKVYDFIWDEFCDWYIEMVKPRLYNSDDAKSQNAALYTLKSVLIDALKLLHPYMPFITEEIFCTLQSEEESIMISRWPEYSEDKNYPKEEKDIEIIKEAVRGIRNIRTEMNVAPSKKATVYVVSEDEGIRRTFEEGKLFFATLSYASEVLVQKDKTGIADDAVSVMIAGAALYIPFAELVDIQAEIERLEKEEKRLAGEIARCEGMLKNEKFISKAPEAKVAEEKEKLAKYTNLAEQVKARLAQLKAM